MAMFLITAKITINRAYKDESQVRLEHRLAIADTPLDAEIKYKDYWARQEYQDVTYHVDILTVNEAIV